MKFFKTITSPTQWRPNNSSNLSFELYTPENSDEEGVYDPNWIPDYNPNVSLKSWKEAVDLKPNIDVKEISSTLPPGKVQHRGLASYLFCCWRDEAGAILRPDMIAGTIISQISHQLCKPGNSLYKHLYTMRKRKLLFSRLKNQYHTGFRH